MGKCRVLVVGMSLFGLMWGNADTPEHTAQLDARALVILQPETSLVQVGQKMDQPLASCPQIGSEKSEAGSYKELCLPRKNENDCVAGAKMLLLVWLFFLGEEKS